jgi:hypothetical protein
MVGVKPRNSFRSLFERLQCLPLPCKYTLSSMNFIVTKKKEQFQGIHPFTELIQGKVLIYTFYDVSVLL